MTLTMFVLRGSVAPKLPQTQVSKWHIMILKDLVRASVNVAALHQQWVVVIAYGKDWDRNGKPNSVTVTARMVSPFARSLERPKKAHSLWDALCAVVQAARAIMHGSSCTPQRYCSGSTSSATAKAQSTSRCVRSWALK